LLSLFSPYPLPIYPFIIGQDMERIGRAMRNDLINNYHESVSRRGKEELKEEIL